MAIETTTTPSTIEYQDSIAEMKVGETVAKVLSCDLMSEPSDQTTMKAVIEVAQASAVIFHTCLKKYYLKINCKYKSFSFIITRWLSVYVKEFLTVRSRTASTASR